MLFKYLLGTILIDLIYKVEEASLVILLFANLQKLLIQAL